jgi:hypothetical protein
MRSAAYASDRSPGSTVKKTLPRSRYVLGRLLDRADVLGMLPRLVGAVHALHQERHPADARLEEGDVQRGEAIEHAAHHDARHLEHLRVGVAQGVHLREAIEPVEAEALRRAAVYREHAAEALGLAIDRVEVGVPERSMQARRGQHAAQHAELGHGATKLGRGLGRILEREESDPAQPRADLQVALREPVVVGARRGDGPVAIAHEAGREAGRRIEHGRLDPARSRKSIQIAALVSSDRNRSRRAWMLPRWKPSSDGQNGKPSTVCLPR